MLIVDLDQTAMMLSSQNGSYFHHQDPWILGFANRDHGFYTTVLMHVLIKMPDPKD